MIFTRQVAQESAEAQALPIGTGDGKGGDGR
jgi:hypothetical protein